MINDLDIKSIQGQILSLAEQLENIKGSFANVTRAIKNKVNRVSLRYDSEERYGIAGAGMVRVSSDGKTVIGIRTMFLGQAFIPEDHVPPYAPRPTASTNLFRIEIGGQTRFIKNIDNNNILHVTEPFTAPVAGNEYSNYVLEQPVTKEILLGDYAFGLLNLDLEDLTVNKNDFQFRGRVNFGSVLEHFGRQELPNDVSTIKFVEDRIQTASKALGNAIRRTGDIVEGPGVPDSTNPHSDTNGRFSYAFNNVNWTFGQSTTLKYQGTPATPGSDIVVTGESLKNSMDAALPSGLFLRGFQMSKNGLTFNASLSSGNVLVFGSMTVAELSGSNVKISEDGTYILQGNVTIGIQFEHYDKQPMIIGKLKINNNDVASNYLGWNAHMTDHHERLIDGAVSLYCIAKLKKGDAVSMIYEIKEYEERNPNYTKIHQDSTYLSIMRISS